MKAKRYFPTEFDCNVGLNFLGISIIILEIFLVCFMIAKYTWYHQLDNI